MKQWQKIIEDQIGNLELGMNPSNLYEPIEYILSLGGKRMRPILVLLGYNLFKDDVESVVDAALAVEVFHNFTLMHDDIMDEAPIRRGMPTVHEKWNSTTAILSGDTMMVKAYDQLLKSPTESIPIAIEKFNKCAIEVCEGQQIDMNYEEVERVSEEEYIEMIRLKTAVLLGFSLEYGALLAGADETIQQQLNQIGQNAGIGFQLMDDLLDVFGDKEKFGKQVGGDIISNKKTYLLIRAYEVAQHRQKEELEAWIEKKEFDPKEKVEAVKNLYRELEIDIQAKNKMNNYFDLAFESIEKLDVSAAGKQKLTGYLEQIMKRDR